MMFVSLYGKLNKLPHVSALQILNANQRALCQNQLSDHFGSLLIASEHIQAIPIMPDESLSMVIHTQTSLTRPVNFLFTLI